MLYLYEAAVPAFLAFAKTPDFAQTLEASFKSKYGWAPSVQEVTSWENSLAAFVTILDHPDFTEAHVIFLKLQMPLSSARCDVLVVGHDKSNAVVIELKQRQHVSPSAVREAVATANKNYVHNS